MDNESWVRTQVRHILIEQTGEDDKPEEKPEEKKSGETTTGPGPGRFKKELKDLKALADVNPQQLMKNLGVSGASGDTPEATLTNLLQRAIRNEHMSNVYKGTAVKKDDYDRPGVLISLSGGLAARDSLIFIRETIKGAQGAGMISPKEAIQVEILGGSILAYFEEKPFRWNKKKRR